MEENIRQFTQTELNLAINYMVIERVARCIGTYEYWEEEYEGIDIIFSKAQKGTLLDTFKEIEADSKETLAGVLEILTNLTGLPGEVLSGKKQINLGLVVDKNRPHAVELSKMSMDELNEYIEDKIGNNKNTRNKYSTIPWVNDIESERAINTLIKEQVGDVKVGQNIDIEAEAAKWLRNPLGLNTLGLYVYLLEEGYIRAAEVKANTAKRGRGRKSNKEKENEISLFEQIEQNASLFNQIEDIIADIYDKNFSNISMEEKRGPEDEAKGKKAKKVKKKEEGEAKNKDKEIIYGYITDWKQNIYSLDCIIYSLIRKRNVALIGQGDGRSEHKILDKDSVEFPVPIVWEDKKEDDNKSDLWHLIDYILKCNYRFTFSYIQLIEESTIEDEIKHHEEELLPILDSKHEIFEELLKDDNITAKRKAEIDRQLSLIDQEISDIRQAYIPGLEASLQQFKADKAGWLEAQRQSIYALQCSIIADATGNPQKEEEAVWKCTALKALMERTEEKANKDKKAWIKVRNPYYKYIKAPKARKTEHFGLDEEASE